MDPITKKTLLEILDLLHSEHPTPKCGYSWCAAVLDLRMPAFLCEHTKTCRTNHDICERIAELKTDVARAEEMEVV